MSDHPVEPNFETELDIALTTAKIALKVISESRSKRIITIKGQDDFATEVDIASEKAMVAYLEANSSHPIQGEEGSPDETSTTRWILDPIDGTSNFINGIPNVGVIIALLENGEPVLGVIASVQNGDLFYATRNGGAFLNGQPISTSKEELGLVAIMVSGVAKDSKHLWSNKIRCKISEELMNRNARIRMVGSSASDLSWVAAGWAGGAITYHNNSWDTYAGVLIIQEAGGVVADIDGKPWSPDSHTIVAAGNPRMLEELLSTIKHVRETDINSDTA